MCINMAFAATLLSLPPLSLSRETQVCCQSSQSQLQPTKDNPNNHSPTTHSHGLLVTIPRYQDGPIPPKARQQHSGSAESP
ncbi:hypothetical protein F5B18DRAFT_614866 [Nemania serpens]|nr:hypothetical protein F5B18DRAFT_614866 [Nemania serpens]